ncbi:MAG: cache domain-containing protein, partial [Deltaproteobacteria bacterium]
MKINIQFKSIKNRLMVWFLVVALLPLVIFSAIIYVQRVESIKAEAFDKLKAIRDLKVGEVNYWLDEKTGDVQVFSKVAEIENIDEVLSGKTGTRNDAKALRTLSDILNGYRESYKDYEEISIISVQSGKIVVSTNKALEGTDVSGSKYFTEPLRTGGVYISDIYESRSMNRPTMEVSVPIHQNSHKGKSPCGVLVARIDLENSVYALLLNRTGLGNTGETLIVNKDGVALNELRWHNRAPLKLKIEAKPALLASQGKTGIVETTDYRGEKVLAAYTHIPRTGWGFVAKMDQKEIYAPINKLLISILILFFVTVAGVCLISLFLARNTAQPIIAMTTVAKRIQEGDLSARNSITSEDEIGFLAESFNQAADSVALQTELREINKDISETL